MLDVLRPGNDGVRDFGRRSGDDGGEASLSDGEGLRLVLRDSKKALSLLAARTVTHS